jgi:type IV pilus assembly protein PilB
MTKAKKRLGEMLIEAGVIDETQLNSALTHQKQWGGKLASILIELGYLDEKAVASVLEKQLNVICVSLKDMDISPEAKKLIDADTAQKYEIIPIDFSKERETLTLAMSDPTDLKAIDELSFLLGLEIKPVLAIKSVITRAIQKNYLGQPVAASDAADLGGHIIDFENLPDEMEITRHEKLKEKSGTEDISQSLHHPKLVIDALLEILNDNTIKEVLVKKISKKLKDIKS